MADISKQREHALDPKQVEARIERLAEALIERIGGEWHWDGDDAVYAGRGAHARVQYTAQTIAMTVKLPLLLKPMRRRIDRAIDHVFDDHFGPNAL